MKTSHDRVIREMESLNEQLKEEQRKVLSLQAELKTDMAVKRQINEVNSAKHSVICEHTLNFDCF